MNWLQLLIPLLFIAGPIIGKTAEWMQKQKKLKAAEQGREAAELEALRTGPRPAPRATRAQTRAPATVQTRTQTSGESAAERMRELARRRQEQLQEYRRQQQATRTSPPRPPTPARTPQRVPTRQQGRPAPTARPPTGQPTRRPQPARPPQPQPVPAHNQGREKLSESVHQIDRRPFDSLAPRQAPPSRRGTPAAAESVAKSAQIRKTEIGGNFPATTSTPKRTHQSIFGAGMSPTDWRRMVIAREVLGPPIGLRKPGEQGGYPG